MSQVRVLHDEAMRLAQLAMVARHQGDSEQAEDLARRAFELEAQAADLIPEDKSSEPTRSILYRSAASLAYQCREFAIAQRLAAKGLSGHPTPQVEQELKDLFEQINFENHLKVKNVVLEDEDLQLSMVGKAVAPGIILYSEFTKRVNTTIDLINRTVQRKMGREYQRRGRVADIYKPYIPALSIPREGSFAITLRLARPEKVQQMPLLFTASQIIDEIIQGIELLNNADETGLRALISQDAYYQHFITSTREMAPDGERISFVGFTSKGKQIGLTRERSDFAYVPDMDDTETDVDIVRPITLEGELDVARSRKQGVIELTDENGQHHLISVREGMDDLVKSYFGEWVVITGIYDGRGIYLTDIQSADD